MQAQQEGLSSFGIAVDDIDGVAAEQIRQIANLFHLDVFVPQVVRVGKVVDRAATKTIEVVIAAQQRAILRQQAEMPLANEGGPISGLPQERGQRGMARRQTGVAAGERLVETNVETVLIASSNQRSARGRADRGVGVGLKKACSARCKTVDVGSVEIGSSVAGNIGVTEVVRQDENDAGRSLDRFGEQPAGT